MSKPSSSNPFRPVVNLTSLPKEIIAQIALLLDRSSAVSFARVSPIITACAEPAIWRNIDLSLNPHHGEYPLIEPYARTASRTDHDWSIGVAKEAEKRYRAALKRKRENLTTLEIVSPVPHVFDEHWSPKLYERIESKFMDDGLHFSSLQHLRLGPGSIRNLGDFMSLINRAPDLVSLAVHFDEALDTECNEELLPYMPPCQLRELYITSDIDPSGESYDHAYAITSFLLYTSQLRRLSLDYSGSIVSAKGSMVDCVRQMENLDDLYWRIESWQLISAFAIGFPSLRRAILISNSWDPTINQLPEIQSLEHIYFITSPGCEMRTSRLPIEKSPSPSPEQTFVSELLWMTMLISMHVLDSSEDKLSGPDLFSRLDKFEMEDRSSVKINSILHGDLELTFATQIRPFTKIACHPVADKLLSLPIGCHAEEYQTKTGLREYIYHRSPTPETRFVADFEGLDVPYEILAKMKEIEDQPESYWRGRQIEVKHSTWAVMDKWLAGIDEELE